MNELVTLLTERRSCRRYLDRAVPREIIDQILEAGLYAPSGENRQTTKCIVIQNEDIIAHLAKIDGIFDGNMDGDPFYGAKTIILVVSDRTNKTYIEDGSLVIGNMLNAAYALGVGSCWVHWAKEVLEVPYGQKLMKEWNIPDEYVGIGFCILGYPEKENRLKPKRKEDRISFVP